MRPRSWVAACDEALWRWSRASQLQALWLAHRGRFLVALALSAIVFHFELTVLNWSIDEELFATANPGPNPAWIGEGRWGMYLVEMLMPIAVMPFVPTAVCLALVAAATVIILSRLAEEDAASFYPAAALAVGCSLLHYLYTFSTISYGFGLAAFTAAVGLALVDGGRSWWRLAAAAGMFAFAIGVYQALLGYILVAGCFLIFRRAVRGAGPGAGALPLLKDAVVFGCVVAAGLGIYGVMAKLAMAAGGVEASRYLAGYVDVGSATAMRDAVLRVWERAVLAYGGSAQFYWTKLHSLKALVSLSGLVILARVAFMPATLGTKIVALGLVGAGLASPFVVYLVAGGADLPLRSLVGVPLAIASLVLCAMRLAPRSVRLVLALLAAVSFFRFASHSHQMSLVTYSSNQQDRDLAVQILMRVQDLTSQLPEGERIPLELVGGVSRRPSRLYEARDIIGLSFFVWGESKRLNAYFRILDEWRFEPADTARRLAVMDRAAAMPAWPDRGAVELVEGVLVVKLGGYLPIQLAGLCGASC